MIGRRRYARKLPAPQFLAVNLALGIGHFVVVLAAGAFLPMLPYVAGSLGVALPYAVWGQSNYVAAMAAAFLIARPLMRRFGAKNTALFGYLMFALCGLGVIVWVPVYPLFVAARAVQGLMAGLCIAPSLALLLEHYRPRKQRVATGLWGLAAFVPFSIGPALGGYFASVLGDWRLLFLGFSALTLLVAGVIWALLGDRPGQRDPAAPLAGPLVLFALWMAALLALQAFCNVAILTDLAGRKIESWWIVAAFGLLVWLFWFANSEARTPLIDARVFGHRNYLFGATVLCLAFIGIQGSIVQYVLRIQSVEGYTAWHAGLLFLPLFVLSKPVSLRAQALIHHGYDPRLIASLSCLGFAASFWWMGEYIRPTTWASLLWPQLFEGAALGGAVISMNAIALSNVPEGQQLHAVDLLSMARTLAAAWIISLSDVLWDRYAALARDHLSGPDIGNGLRFLAQFGGPDSPSGPALHHLLQQRLAAQSGWLTFNAMFHALAAGFVLLAGLVWLASATHLSHRVDTLERVVESLAEDL